MNGRTAHGMREKIKKIYIYDRGKEINTEGNRKKKIKKKRNNHDISTQD